MFSAKTSGAIVLSVGVACIIAVICLAIWIVVLVDTVNKDSQSINEISIKISRLSTSLGHSHNTVRNYYPRLFEGASGLLGGASKTAEEHGWTRLANLTASSMRSVDSWQAAYREGQSAQQLNQLRSHVSLQLARVLEEASGVSSRIRAKENELVSQSLFYVVALGSTVLAVMVILAAFYYFGVMRPLEETTALVDDDTTTLEQIQKRFLVKELRAFAARLFQAKLAAEASDRAKSVFLATMSHELRTPLNAIIGFSSIMKDGTFGRLENERYRGYTGDILESAENLLEVINDILDLSKVEAGKLDLNESDFDVVALVQKVVEYQEPTWAKKQQNVSVEATSRLPLLQADLRLVRQSIGNLVSNAIKFTPERGEILLCCAVGGHGGIEIEIRDSGPGIDPENIMRVSEPFFQANRKLDVAHEGTGLGLALCRRFVELHGGGLSLNNLEEGGTKVSLVFPPERAVPRDDTAPTAIH